MVTKRLRLMAQDGEDLSVLAATLQDSLVKVGDMIYLPKRRRFVAVLNRFKWEEADLETLVAETTPCQRVMAGLHFDGVLGVQSQNIRLDRPDAVLELLTVMFEDTQDDGGTITFVFAGSGMIRLHVECIDAVMSDMTQPWQAQTVPQHGVIKDDKA